MQIDMKKEFPNAIAAEGYVRTENTSKAVPSALFFLGLISCLFSVGLAGFFLTVSFAYFLVCKMIDCGVDPDAEPAPKCAQAAQLASLGDWNLPDYDKFLAR